MTPRFSLKINDHLHDPEKKKDYNEAHFSEAASRYDVATRAMSLGRDRAWKRQLIEALPAMAAPRCVDLACGTGDIVLALSEKYPKGQILGLDIAEPMLAVARQRSSSGNLSYLCQDMCSTTLEEGSVDILTGSYAIRNAPDIGQALAEIARILKPGGVVALLDFSKPVRSQVQSFNGFLLKYWCGLWGLLLHGNPEIHSYIAASLRTFPDRVQLRSMLAENNLHLNSSRSFYFGLLELLVLQKGTAQLSPITAQRSPSAPSR